MSSFFTLPASQRKRKHSQIQQKSNWARKARKGDDDSISGSDVSEDDARARIAQDEGSDEDEEEFEDEDLASKRIRLAE
jgi:ribosomal RNA-processing protein 9